MPHPLRFESKKGRFCVACVWNREGTEKLVNGKQHSVWFVPTGMKGLPQNVLLNFRLEIPKSDLTIYLLSGISEIFRQTVSTPCFFKGHFQVAVSLGFKARQKCKVLHENELLFPCKYHSFSQEEFGTWPHLMKN